MEESGPKKVAYIIVKLGLQMGPSGGSKMESLNSTGISAKGGICQNAIFHDSFDQTPFLGNGPEKIAIRRSA